MPQDAPPNGDAPDPVPVGPWSRVAEMQAKLHRWAAADPGRRFDDLFNFVHDPATLLVAFARVEGNRGANTAGVDGLTAAVVAERLGVPGFLEDLRAQLKTGAFRPLPVRERMIPKPGGSGKLRRLGIPTIADRVVQAALKLVLEPIFEADFAPVSYGFRPGRRAHDAIADIHRLGTQGYRWVLDADIEACFDSIDHTALMGRVRRRVADKRVLALVKAFLKAGILTETGALQESDTGTPQGGILSPLLVWVPKTRSSLCDLGVFVEEAAEPVTAGDLDVSAGMWVRERPQRCGLAEGAVRTVLVEVPLVFGQDRERVTLVEDEDPVQQLAPEAAHEALGDGVRPRRPYRRGQDLHAGGGEDGVEDPAELAVVVADEEPERLAGVFEVHQQVAGQLGQPLPGRMGGDAEDPDPAGGVLDDEEAVQAGKGHGLHMEEVAGEDRVSLRLQELCPGRS